jgi:hypothetical protein
VCVGVLLESARIYNFQGISRGNWRFCSTMELPKCVVFQGLTSFGIRVFEPGGQGFESLRAHFLSKYQRSVPGTWVYTRYRVNRKADLFVAKRTFLPVCKYVYMMKPTDDRTYRAA